MERQRSQHTKRQIQFSRFDRVAIIIFGFIGTAILIIIRLAIVQIIEHPFYAALASGQHELVKQLLPERGEIYAQDRFSEGGLSVLATNQTVHHVYVNPKQIVDPVKTTEVLAPILGLDPTVLEERMSKEDDLYEPLKQEVSDQEIEALEQAIEENKLEGIHWTPQDARIYPEGEIGSAITGFVGIVDDQKKGQYGLEGYFDEELSGTEGYLSTELDTSGRFIAVGDKSIVEAQDGDMLILTIDKNIQYKACSLLQEAVEKHQANQGSIIIINPKTGAIMAMCNAPQYNPNNYSEVEDIGVYLNDAISDQYEPGSVFKPVVMAAAINEGQITPYTTYEDKGVVRVDKYNIRNSDGKANGVVDMTVVLERSLNTGAIFAVQKVGNEKWYDYVEAFGFGKPTGITLSGENPGDLSSLALKRDIYSATSSYGQGLTVTPLQMLQSFATIANDGVLMKPYIVDRIVKSNGYQEQTQPQVIGQPITAEAARTVAAMLVRVIDVGHAKRAGLDGYFLAGKTGTAQIPDGQGGYDQNRHKDTFAGFGPVSDPQFAMLIKIDEPKDALWSEASTAPIFHELAQYLVNYLQIPPDRIE